MNWYYFVYTTLASKFLWCKLEFLQYLHNLSIKNTLGSFLFLKFFLLLFYYQFLHFSILVIHDFYNLGIERCLISRVITIYYIYWDSIIYNYFYLLIILLYFSLYIFFFYLFLMLNLLKFTFIGLWNSWFPFDTVVILNHYRLSHNQANN